VPVATGHGRVGPGEHLPGGDDVEHGQALDLAGVVEGVAVGDPSPAVVAGQQGDPRVAEVAGQGPDVLGTNFGYLFVLVPYPTIEWSWHLPRRARTR
jgi:hypothetical protein